jgi:hypothetical protein
MKPALLLFLAALPLSAAPAAVLADDTYQFPAGDWRLKRFQIGPEPATVDVQFHAMGGEARAELVSRPNVDLFHKHKQHDALAYTDSTSSGGFSRYIHDPGEYAVIIENTESRPIAVHLTLTLSYGPRQPASRYLSPARRLTVILVSFTLFFAIVTLSARAILRAMKSSY